VAVGAHERAGQTLGALAGVDLRIWRDELARVAVRLRLTRRLAVLGEVDRLILVVAAELAHPDLHLGVDRNVGAGPAEGLRVTGFGSVADQIHVLVGAAPHARPHRNNRVWTDLLALAAHRLHLAARFSMGRGNVLVRISLQSDTPPKLTLDYVGKSLVVDFWGALTMPIQ
jgi:hypothetical protein